MTAQPSSRAGVLITGSSGYIAHSLIDSLAATHYRILCVTRPGGQIPLGPGRAQVEVVPGAIGSREFWDEALIDVDLIHHLAAQTSVYAAEQDPILDLNANVLPMLQVLEACRRLGRRPGIVFAGTVTQCGIPIGLPVNETHPDDPVTIYDLHKLMAERYLKEYAAREIVRGAALRLANVYGPGPSSRSADRGVLNAMIRKALNGEELTVYGKGEQVRDYVYVGDVADAFARAGSAIDSLNGGHYIIGSGTGHTIAEAVELVAARAALRTGKLVRVVHVDPPASLSPIEARNFVADTRRFTELTGWRARVSLAEGIDRTIEAVLTEQRVKA